MAGRHQERNYKLRQLEHLPILLSVLPWYPLRKLHSGTHGRNRPTSIGKGVKFFREVFDGDVKLPSCNIPYSFNTLYQNKLINEERLGIIQGSEKFTAQTASFFSKDYLIRYVIICKKIYLEELQLTSHAPPPLQLTSLRQLLLMHQYLLWNLSTLSPSKPLTCPSGT